MQIFACLLIDGQRKEDDTSMSITCKQLYQYFQKEAKTLLGPVRSKFFYPSHLYILYSFPPSPFPLFYSIPETPRANKTPHRSLLPLPNNVNTSPHVTCTECNQPHLAQTHTHTYIAAATKTATAKVSECSSNNNGRKQDKQPF